MSDTPAAFWSYRAAGPTPIRQDLPPGTFKGTTAEWESFSPGMRRAIAREADRRILARAKREQAAQPADRREEAA
jgi:hypothetical protein